MVMMGRPVFPEREVESEESWRVKLRVYEAEMRRWMREQGLIPREPPLASGEAEG